MRRRPARPITRSVSALAAALALWSVGAGAQVVDRGSAVAGFSRAMTYANSIEEFCPKLARNEVLFDVQRKKNGVEERDLKPGGIYYGIALASAEEARATMLGEVRRLGKAGFCRDATKKYGPNGTVNAGLMMAR